MRVKPREGLQVPYPQNPSRSLPADGDDVPETNYWIRRVLDGDVVRIDESTVPTGSEPIAPLTTRRK